MSVQTQIDRISGAVSAALTAIAEKGVTVPAGTKVDGLAALIAAIEAGGGSGGGVTIKTGNITPASSTSSLSITHGLGVIPKFFFLYSKDATSGYIAAAMYSDSENILFDGELTAVLRFTASNVQLMSAPLHVGLVSATAQEVTINVSRISSNFGTKQHDWFAFAWEE